MPMWGWIAVGLVAVIALVFVVFVIAHFPRDGSF